jgi:hypothetical protein
MDSLRTVIAPRAAGHLRMASGLTEILLAVLLPANSNAQALAGVRVFVSRRPRNQFHISYQGISFDF